MLIVLLPEAAHAGAEPPAALHWWRLDKENRVADQGHSALSELRGRFAGERIRALVPASAVTLYRIAIPVRRASAVRAALPFALEDSLSQELDELHFVAGPRRPDGKVAAAVVEHANMRAWQSWFNEAGWRLEALVPLAALHADQSPEHGLRAQASSWPSSDEQLVVTSLDREPAIIERSLASFWIQRALAARDGEDQYLELVGLQPQRIGLTVSEAVSVRDDEPGDLQVLLARAARPSPILNLLVAPYSSGTGAPPWRKLRGVGLAASVLIAVLGIQLAGEWFVLSNERDALEARINALFDQTLPNARRVQPVTQFQQILEGAGQAGAAGGTMGPLLYESLAVVSAGGKGRIAQFRATPAEIEIEVQLESFAELEAIRETLGRKEGLRENLQGADSGAEGVTARLRIDRGES